MTRTVHFLLVDDLPENLLALEGLLRRDGLTLHTARSGPEALELLLVHEVALALIDVQMPGMDGFELAELMRGTERTRRVPIIFLTAGGPDWQRRFRGYETGAVDFLFKPIEPHVLRSKAEVFFELARQREELRAVAAENARLLEESRRTAETLRQVDRRKDEFLATLAHELRNPLAPIRNAIQILRMAGPSDPRLQQVQDMIERQVAHMVHLVDDLLDVSRITRGKIELRLEALSLAAVVQNAVEASSPLIEAARHQLFLDLPAEPILIRGDVVRLTQVVSNLLNNAAKYTPAGGQIRVSVAREGEQAVVRVRDTGLGIPADMLPRVFDLFTQVNRHLERSQGGLGIGLALVKQLVEMHGGTVEACSDGPDRGAEFVARLPLPASGGNALPLREGQPAGLPRRRIVVVDDNADAADSLALMLHLNGHEVRTAHDGMSALDLAATFHPDVMLLDLGMPVMDGYETARRIRGLTGGAEIQLIALTGWGQEEDRRRSAAAGFDGHLVKPTDPDDLERLLSARGRPGDGRSSG